MGVYPINLTACANKEPISDINAVFCSHLSVELVEVTFYRDDKKEVTWIVEHTHSSLE